MSRLPEDQKIAIIKSVINGKQTIVQAAAKFGISRTCLYEWLKKFSDHGDITNRIVRGKSHPRTLNFHLEQRLWELVSKHPAKSIGALYKLSRMKGIRVGRHGLQNFLARNGLNTREKRLQRIESKLTKYTTRTKGKLSGRDRLHYIKEILAGTRTVSSISRETGISRFSLYEWLNKYKNGGENEASLASRFRKSHHHYKFLPEKTVNQILDTIIVSPDLSLSKLYVKVKAAGVSVGHHGIQNVLERYQLNTLAARRLYAQKLAGFQKIVPRIHDAGRIAPLIEQLTPNLLPAPPPAISLSWREVLSLLLSSVRSSIRQFIRHPLTQANPLLAALISFSIPICGVLVALGTLNYLNIILTAPSLAIGIGYFFASIALGLGMFFFLYSFKYYASVVLVLMFSRNITQDDNDVISSEARDLAKRNSIVSDSASRLDFSPQGLGVRNDGRRGTGLIPDISQVELERHPFVSIHLPLFNEKRVVNRLLEAVTSMEYVNFEVIVADDSTDETKDIVLEWKNHPRIKISHRDTRQGFKGGALREALKLMDPRTEFVLVFDSDFLPYPDTIVQFLKYFKATCGTLDFSNPSSWRERERPIGSLDRSGDAISYRPAKQGSSFQHDSGDRIAAIQGYQWHVLNKSENWITRGVRSEYAGSYVVERSGAEIYGGLKQIAGSVYMIRADLLKQYGWGDSITEDFELTLKLYRDGYKVVYTPYIQAPSECVSTIKHLVRQRMRWAEGHSHNIKRMFKEVLFGQHVILEARRADRIPSGISDSSGDSITSPPRADSFQNDKGGRVFLPTRLTFAEKFEFIYLSPYYLQSFFFLTGTFSWFIAETVFRVRLPFWTELWGWSLVLTNMLSLPLMNLVGMFLEEAEEKDYLGVFSFVLLTYIVAPFQAYASVKGFLEKEEGPWFRTPKTGHITDVFKRGRFYRWLSGIFPGGKPAVTSLFQIYRQPQFLMTTANNQFNSFSIKPKRLRWVSKSVLAILLIFTLIFGSLSVFVSPVEATNRGADYGQYTDIFCPTDTDCKISYRDVTNADLRMSDCDNATCSSGNDRAVDETDNVGNYTSIYCIDDPNTPATDPELNCKMSYEDGSNFELKMADCDDATCSTKTLTTVDSSLLIVGEYTSIYCLSSTDCKISHYESETPGLRFADCDNSTCSSNNSGTRDDLNNAFYTSIYCPSSGDCKISYQINAFDPDLRFADCNNANCAAPALTTVDSTGSVGLYTSIYCPAADDCKISYYDQTNGDLKMVDCNDTDCRVSGNPPSGQATITTIDTGGVVGEYTSIYCLSSTDCKISYFDNSNGDLKMVDCDDSACTSGNRTITTVDTGGVSQGCLVGNCVGKFNSIYCPSSTDCKISYYDQSNGDLKFADCDNAACSTGTQTTVALSVPEFIGFLLPVAPFFTKIVQAISTKFGVLRRNKKLWKFRKR